jgi:hypothetical protein
MRDHFEFIRGTVNEVFYTDSLLFAAAELEAAGFQWPRDFKTEYRDYLFGKDSPGKPYAAREFVFDKATALAAYRAQSRKDRSSQPKFNGGMVGQMALRLTAGERLFRFADSRKKSLAECLAGGWWFDIDTYLFFEMHCFQERVSRGDLSILDKKDLEGSRDNRHAFFNSAFQEMARVGLAVVSDFGDMRRLIAATLKADYWVFRGSSAAASGERRDGSTRERVHNRYEFDVSQLFIPGSAMYNPANMNAVVDRHSILQAF